ncbi:hypothetical protein [Xylanibacter ruminicola]
MVTAGSLAGSLACIWFHERCTPA